MSETLNRLRRRRVATGRKMDAAKVRQLAESPDRASDRGKVDGRHEIVAVNGIVGFAPIHVPISVWIPETAASKGLIEGGFQLVRGANAQVVEQADPGIPAHARVVPELIGSSIAVYVRVYEGCGVVVRIHKGVEMTR
jgi:hypothetical protein